MPYTPQIALLKFDDELLLPTEVYRIKSLDGKSPKPDQFELSISIDDEEPQNSYRHFKNDIRLTKTDLGTPVSSEEDEESGWHMSTAKGKYTPLDEITGQSGEGNYTYFSPLDAAEMFLAKVCRRVVDRVQKMFGKDQDIRIHFTQPNYQYRKGDKSGTKLSGQYRDHIREIVERQLTGSVFKNVDFQTGGRDFLYEPYGVYYYYSLLEHHINLNEGQAGKTYLVFDMGGSTTDIAVVQVNQSEGNFRIYPICTSIGQAGNYFDQYILKDLLGRQQVPRRSKKWNSYLDKIEQAKIDICERRRRKVQLEIEEDGERTEHEITPQLIERLVKEWWDNKNLLLGYGFRRFVREVQTLARDHGSFQPFDGVERIFLAGGSTGLPGINDLIKRDLRNLELLADRETVDTVPSRRLFTDESVPNSSLAAIGQAASLAETSREHMLEEGEEVYVRVVNPDGEPYRFTREDGQIGDPKQKDEFLLCTKAELQGRDIVKFEPDGYLSLSEIKVDPAKNLPEDATAYFRSDVNDYPEEPQKKYSESIDSEVDLAEEACLRFTSHLELSDGEIKAKPFLWHIQRKYSEDYKHPLETTEDGSFRVDLRPDSAGGDIHICIDFGMSNTAVAVHAPGRKFPHEADDLAIFDLHKKPPSIEGAIKLLVPTEALPKTETVEGIRKAHRAVGFHPDQEGIYRLVRGAFARAYWLSKFEKDDEAIFEKLAQALRERSGASIHASTLEREAVIANAALDLHSDNLAALSKWLKQVTEEGEPSLQQIEDELPPVSLEETGEEQNRQRQKENREQMENGQPKPTESEDETSTPVADGHWAVGMAEWMENLVEKYAQPIRESSNETASDLRELQGEVDALREQLMEDEQREEDDNEGGAGEKGDDTRTDLKAEAQIIGDEVSNKESPLFRFSNEEDKDLESFRNFVKDKGYFYSEEALRKVWTHCVGDGKRLVILAGPPGCGKTSLVELSAEFFNNGVPEDARGTGSATPGWRAFHLLQPVSPSWFSSDGLLGSVSAIDGSFRWTEFLKFLIKAEQHYLRAWEGPGAEKARDFFVCLDEFNIAHPEQYLADILSRMEAEPLTKGRRLNIGTESTAQDASLEVDLTTNVKLFATINTDATTKNLSPKVLDRSMYVPMTPESTKLEEAADYFHEKHGVVNVFHEEFTRLLPELDHLARLGQAPIGFRGIEQAYAYAKQHPEVEKELATVMDDVLVSFFLSKLPGAYAINDPAGAYLEAVEDVADTDGEKAISEYDAARGLLNNIALGLPGQAAL